MQEIRDGVGRYPIAFRETSFRWLPSHRQTSVRMRLILMAADDRSMTGLRSGWEIRSEALLRIEMTRWRCAIFFWPLHGEKSGPKFDLFKWLSRCF